MTDDVAVLTVREVSYRLRVGERTVWRLIASGDLRSVKIRRRRMVRTAEVDRYLRLAEQRGRMA